MRTRDPTLHTKRLDLVPPTVRFAEDLFEYGSDPTFSLSIGVRPQQTVGEACDFIARLAADNESGNRLYFIAVQRDRARAVGTLGLNFIFASQHRVADFGYGFNPDVWGTGLFQEAARAILEFGFDELSLARVQLTTRSNNVRAIRSVEKMGFRHEGVLRSFYIHDGRRYDGVVMGLLAGEFSGAEKATDSSERDESPSRSERDGGDLGGRTL